MTDPVQQMLDLDPLGEAERLTGKSYKEDPETMRLGFGLHILHAQGKAEELERRDDTSMRTPFAETLRIYTDLGFDVVHEHLFPGTYSDRREAFLVLFRPDGVLAKVESYGESTSTSQVYYNWEHPVDGVDRWALTSSGHYHTPSYDAGRRIWIGNHDVREGLRHKLARLEANGRFRTPWIERPFLWLLDFSQTKVKDYDHEAITADVVSRLPRDVQRVIAAPSD